MPSVFVQLEIIANFTTSWVKMYHYWYWVPSSHKSMY